MHNRPLEAAEQQIMRLMSWVKSPSIRMQLHLILDNVRQGIAVSQADIDAAMDASLRSSEFDGDQVGRPADDFD